MTTPNPPVSDEYNSMTPEQRGEYLSKAGVIDRSTLSEKDRRASDRLVEAARQELEDVEHPPLRVEDQRKFAAG